MMTATIFIIAFGCLSLAAIYFAIRGQCASIETLEQLEGNTKPVDLAAFQNLIDPREQEFLRLNLSKECYRRIQQDRVLISIEYLRCAAHNAALLIRVGEALRDSPEPAIRESAMQLVNSAMWLRLFALAAIVKLRFNIFFPGLSLTTLSARYNQVAESVCLLSRLKDPVSTSHILSSL
jgi:hypothetical protein